MRKVLAWFALLALLATSAIAAEVSVGVLALRGVDKTLESWSATARYLERQIPGNTFRIVPLGFE
ncbi:MAG: hypothetical protein Q7U32_07015, partial [Rhodocyclaceae bacterium]|nr:hypothetical protein [Rhodocyclaceae bacterium]